MGSLSAESDATIYHLLEKAVYSSPQRGIDIYAPGRTGESLHISYRDLFHKALQNGDAIRAIPGIRAESVILLHFDNHLDGLVWFWSVVCAGYVPALSPPFVNNLEQHRKHLTHLKRLLNDPIILTTDKFVPYIRENCDGMRIESINTPQFSCVQRSTGYSNLVSRGPGNQDPKKVAVLMLTSGSSGFAKAVCLRNSQIIAAIRGKIACHKTTSDDVFFNWINVDHVANLVEVHLHALYLNARQIHAHAADLIPSPLKFLSLIDEHRISFSFAPNFFLANLARILQGSCEIPTIHGARPDLSCLKCITSGGEALVVKTCITLASALEVYGAPKNTFVPGFGMTETCAGCIHNNNFPEYDVQHDLQFAALGVCHADIEMRVVTRDDATGSMVAAQPGVVGQLHLRGRKVFSEYYNDEKSTQAAFSTDGWFITGDLALIDDSGMLHLAGREDNAVNINGVKHNITDLQTALDMANLPGVVPSYTVVFGHRPPYHDTEVVSVVYIPSFAPEDGPARFAASNAIETTVLLQCSAKPYRVIPLSKENLQKTSLGKLSPARIRKMFDAGDFSEQEELNAKLLNEYFASLSDIDSEEVDGIEATQTEASIRQALSETMDVPSTDLRLDMGVLQMGVNSMQLIQFKKRVQELLCIDDIPIITILTKPTIRQLASAIDERVTKTSKKYDPVVVMNAAGSATPLWLIHPGAGEVLVYLNLAKYFAEERPVYAIRARGFDGEPFFDSVDECIGTYTNAVRRVQPEGPYCILGYSFGSMFAFEIAKRLRADGSEISFLGILNLPPHIKQRIRQLNMITAVLTLALFLDLVKDDDPETFMPNMEKMTYDDVLDEILENRAPKGRMKELALDRAKLLRWAEVSNALHEMAWNYEPTGMVYCIDVFVAHPLKAVASNREDWFAQQVSRWVYFSKSLPRFHEADGEHFSMISAEHVHSFQEKLKAAMKARGA